MRRDEVDYSKLMCPDEHLRAEDSTLRARVPLKVRAHNHEEEDGGEL